MKVDFKFALGDKVVTKGHGGMYSFVRACYAEGSVDELILCYQVERTDGHRMAYNEPELRLFDPEIDKPLRGERQDTKPKGE